MVSYNLEFFPQLIEKNSGKVYASSVTKKVGTSSLNTLAKSLQELPSRVAELVGLKVDVIVTWTTPGTLAAKQGTTTIPIVMSGTGADPVAAGFVSSLERPGGNITGLSMLSTELSGKRLELLKETVPNLGRVAVLRNPKFPAVAIQSKETEEAAKSLGLSSKPGKCATRRKLTAPLLL